MERCTQINPDEAPEGFYAVLKVNKGYNICEDCDARKLCQDNANNWCAKNRCMAYAVTDKQTGRTLERKDGCSVVFKKLKD